MYQPWHRDASSFVDLRSDLNANSAPLWRGWYRSVYAFCVQGIISKMALRWHRGDVTVPNCWIKSLFLFYFRKKYSRRFITLWLNHWWQMKYSGDAFHTFMDLDSAIYLAVNGTVTSLLVFIQNILNCVLKTNEAFTGSERHGGKWKTTTFSFWGGVSL